MSRLPPALAAPVLAVVLAAPAQAAPGEDLAEPGWGIEVQAGPGVSAVPFMTSWSGGASIFRETGSLAAGGRAGFVRDRIRGDGVLALALDLRWSAWEHGDLTLGPLVGLGWGIGFYPDPWGHYYWDECGMVPGVACPEPAFSRGIVATLGMEGVERVGRFRAPARLAASWLGKGLWVSLEVGVGWGGRRPTGW